MTLNGTAPLLTAKELERLLSNCDLSPEQFGALMGVSGMSIRRWMGKDKTPGKGIPKGYEAPLSQALYGLLAQGKLSIEDSLARKILNREAPAFFATSLERLCGGTLPHVNPQDPEAWVEILNTIGLSEERRNYVEEKLTSNEMRRFEAQGADWKSKISYLKKVLTNKRLPHLHLSVACGALFYLLNPFDLIPDFVPFAGLLDDYATLGAAFAFYERWFSESLKPTRA